VWLLPFQATAFARICCPDPHEKRTNRELLITDFNQIEIEKAMTGERLKLIILLMQDLNLSFVVKVGAIPQPILATIVLMTELNKADQPETEGQQSLEYVDFENLVRPSTKPGSPGGLQRGSGGQQGVMGAGF
jgi:hypothetical protein